MGLQSLIMFKKSCQILVTCIIFASFTVKSISTCLPTNCGNGSNISHPFWIPQKQESSCGFPGFEITCKRKNPVLTINNDDYVVRDIFYSNYSILLVSAEVYDEINTCPTPIRNFTLDGSPFSYSPCDADLYFYYNCTSPYEEMRYSVDCPSNAYLHSFAVFHPEILEEMNYSVESCQDMVNGPVTGENIDAFFRMKYTDVLRKGFVLQWDGVECSNFGKSGTKANLVLKLIIGFATAGSTVFIMCLIFFLYQRRKKKHYAASSYTSRNISSYCSSMMDLEKPETYHGVHIFKYSELEKATNHFDSKKELGDGGFGTVYQGKLQDGRVVAVKRLYENNYKRVEQFINEVEILARLRHQNLVSLFGCTTHHSRELLLVYEYIPNGTVADHLHGEKCSNPSSLTWTTRMSIAIETATALAYLHASDVIHRDVKTNNILLDNNFCVKVADFGLSRLFPNNVTHVSTAPQGTPGYVDPEYHQCYQLTVKSDVYSFGVVLIELISSKPAVDITRHRHEINLSNMAINKIKNDALDEFVDPCLGFGSDYKVRKMISAVAELAFQCLQNGRDMRPCMDEVLETLRGIQSEEFSQEKKKNEELDDAVLLKNNPQILSPDSVHVTWVSNSSASNSSG